MPDRPMNTSSDSRSLEARITLALEHAPDFAIPEGFAARIASRFGPLERATITPRRYGRHAAIVSMAVLLVLMFALAHRAASPSPLWVTMEWIYSAQFALLAVWLGARSAKLTSF